MNIKKNTQQMERSKVIQSITKQKRQINRIIKTMKECGLYIIVYTEGRSGRTVNDRRVYIKKTFTLSEIEVAVEDAAKYIRPTLENNEFKMFINSLEESKIRVENYI